MASGPDERETQDEVADKVADEVLVGAVERLTYRDPESLYSVLKLTPEGTYKAPGDAGLFASERVTAVGKAIDVSEGMRVRLTGHWDRHRTHGVQFAFETLETLSPVSEAGLVRYLASKTFEGIGETLARRIVGKLGSGALDKIRENPECLAGIRGLRVDVRQKLVDRLHREAAAHETLAFLYGLGLGPLRARAVLAQLGPDCESQVREDPYLLATVPGLAFPSADKIALELGFARDDPRRLSAALGYTLQVAADDGHSCLTRGELLEQASERLRHPADRPAFEEALEKLAQTEEVRLDDSLVDGEDGEPLVYIPRLHTSETGLAQNLAHLLNQGAVRPLADEEALAEAERAGDIHLDPLQRDAVLTLLRESVCLLTGGPGVGKTTIVRLVTRLAERAGMHVALASPTGRAAKRLAEATGRDASTVHRLLRFEPGTTRFLHDQYEPLQAGVVIVDEISMLDVVLAHHLLKAIRPPTRLILVGDPDQLPSVGPGNVLRDLLDSGCVPVARLTRVFRQDPNSLIVSNAHRILAGERPEWPASGNLDSDFYFFPADDPESCAERVVEVVTRRIPDNFDIPWVRDVQVIAPMYRGACGVDALNDRLREALGVGGREVVHGGRRWRIGDRVIHTRNDYEREVFNGDMGTIIGVTEVGAVTVRYPSQDVIYEGSELSDLRAAFAITVHRSQGGEFPAVVLPLSTQHYMMLQRNLLYTAVTRAQRLVVIVGSRRALEMAIDNDQQKRRESGLAARLERLQDGT